MAVLSTVIEIVRRGLHDAPELPENQIYGDDVYQDAVDYALGRLNFALRTAHTLADLPSKYDFLLVLAAKITICQIRKAENQNPDVTEILSSGDAGLLMVPDLQIQESSSEGGTTETSSPVVWEKLCKELEDEWVNTLNRAGIEGSEEAASVGTVKCHTARRVSRYTGRSVAYATDTPIPMPAVTASVQTPSRDGSKPVSVLLQWSQVTRGLEFRRIEIRRTVDDPVINPVKPATPFDYITNTHIVHFEDLNVESGKTYRYLLSTVNSNEILGHGTVVEVEVP